MDIDRDRIDEAILALLFLGRHDEIRAWKSFDWAAMGTPPCQRVYLGPRRKS